MGWSGPGPGGSGGLSCTHVPPRPLPCPTDASVGKASHSVPPESAIFSHWIRTWPAAQGGRKRAGDLYPHLSRPAHPARGAPGNQYPEDLTPARLLDPGSAWLGLGAVQPRASVRPSLGLDLYLRGGNRGFLVGCQNRCQPEPTPGCRSFVHGRVMRSGLTRAPEPRTGSPTSHSGTK